MSRSTTHRYVATLVALGYLERVAQRNYRLGLRVTDLGMTVLNATPLREHAHPYLLELRQSGSRVPVYCTAMGKLLLASLSAGDQRELLSVVKLSKRAPNTITGKKALREELERIRVALASRAATRSSLRVLSRSQWRCVTRLAKSSPRWAWPRTPR